MPALRTLHRASAGALGIFLLLHIANHLVGLTGETAHIQLMGRIRPIYRNAWIEPVLLGLLLWQGLSGVVLVIRGWRARHGFVGWAQALSGLYLAAFLFHVAAVLTGRAIYHLDTDFRFAAAGFHVPGWPWFFTPYYFLALFALFSHLGCALFWNLPESRARRLIVPGALLFGGLVGGAVVLSLAGWLYPVDIPARYLATFHAPAP